MALRSDERSLLDAEATPSGGTLPSSGYGFAAVEVVVAGKSGAMIKEYPSVATSFPGISMGDPGFGKPMPLEAWASFCTSGWNWDLMFRFRRSIKAIGKTMASIDPATITTKADHHRCDRPKKSRWDLSTMLEPAIAFSKFQSTTFRSNAKE